MKTPLGQPSQLYRVAILLLTISQLNSWVFATVSACQISQEAGETLDLSSSLCEGSFICFSVQTVSSVNTFYIKFTRDPTFYWSDPEAATLIALNDLYLPQSLYHITKTSDGRAKVTLNIYGYVPSNTVITVRIYESDSVTPVLAHNAACGTLLEYNGKEKNPRGYALFLNISGAIQFFALLSFTLVDYSWGALFRRSLLLDMMLYLRFVNIDLPNALRSFFNLAKKSYIAAALPGNIFAGEKNQVLERFATGKFTEFEYENQFLLSFGDEIGSIIILVIFQLLIAILPYIGASKNRRYRLFIRHMNRALNFNLILDFLLAYSLRAFINIFLNFSNAKNKNALEMASLVFSILFFLLYLTLAVLMVRYQRRRRTAIMRFVSLETQERYITIFDDYKEENSFQQSFSLITLGRSFLVALVLVTMQGNGTAQLALLLLMQLIYLLYFFYYLPNFHFISLITQSFGELMLMFLIIAWMGLGSLNNSEFQSSEPAKTIGWACILLIFFYALFVFLLMIYELVLHLRKLIRWIKSRQTQTKTKSVKKVVVLKKELENILASQLTPVHKDPIKPQREVTIEDIEELPPPEPEIVQDESSRSQSQLVVVSERDRKRREQREFLKARKALREVFEWEIQNKILDELLDEVQTINQAREREQNDGVLAADPLQRESNKHEMKSIEVRIKPNLEQRLELSAQEWEDSKKLTDKIVKKTNSYAAQSEKQIARYESQIEPRLDDFMKSSANAKGGRNNQHETPSFDKTDDTSFIENLLHELPSESKTKKQKVQKRRLSGQSDTFGENLALEADILSSKNNQIKEMTERQNGQQLNKTNIIGLQKVINRPGPSNTDILNMLVYKHSEAVANEAAKTEINTKKLTKKGEYLMGKVENNPLYEYSRRKNQTSQLE